MLPQKFSLPLQHTEVLSSTVYSLATPPSYVVVFSALPVPFPSEAVEPVVAA